MFNLYKLNHSTEHENQIFTLPPSVACQCSDDLLLSVSPECTDGQSGPAGKIMPTRGIMGEVPA